MFDTFNTICFSFIFPFFRPRLALGRYFCWLDEGFPTSPSPSFICRTKIKREGLTIIAIKKNVNPKKTCSCCNRNLGVQSNYYKIQGVKDPIFTDGYYPICKQCLDDLVKDEVHGFDYFIKILMALNKPFLTELLTACDNDYPTYLKKVQLQKVKGQFLDSDRIFPVSKDAANADDLLKLSPEELRDCELYWGKGDYTEDDYIYLMSRFEEYLNMYEDDSPSFTGLVAQICHTEFFIRQLRFEGKDTSKHVTQLTNLLKTAGIAPAQEKEAKAQSQETVGTLIKKYEVDRPIPEPLAEFKDVDGIEKYFHQAVLGPMLETFGKENPYADEYQEVKEKYGISQAALMEEVQSEQEKGEL